MPYTVFQTAGSSAPIGTFPTAQDIISRVSVDIRKFLSDSGADASILLEYVDRVHRLILRQKRWRFLLAPIKTFNTVIGTSDYFIGVGVAPVGASDCNLDISDLKEIHASSMFNRTDYRALYPTAEAPLVSSFVVPAKPRLWRHDSDTPDIVTLYPAPDKVYAIEFRYWIKQFAITALSQPLQIPTEYLDIVVAGVNMFAYEFLKNDPQATAFWRDMFQKGLRDMVRDEHQIPRGAQYVSPDPGTQKTGFPFNAGTMDDFFARMG